MANNNSHVLRKTPAGYVKPERPVKLCVRDVERGGTKTVYVTEALQDILSRYLEQTVWRIQVYAAGLVHFANLRVDLSFGLSDGQVKMVGFEDIVESDEVFITGILGY